MEHLGIGVSAYPRRLSAGQMLSLNVLALIASTIEKIALEIRIAETESGSFEPFGRSKRLIAMPHKRNPILCERLCGMARPSEVMLLSARNIALCTSGIFRIIREP